MLNNQKMQFSKNEVFYKKNTNQESNINSIFNDGIDTYNHGNYSDAINYFTNVISKDPNNAEAYNYRGKAYANLEDYEQAINDFTKAIELAPYIADYYYNRGLTYLKLEKNDLAIIDFTKAIELKPDFAKAYNNRGFAYMSIEEYDKALRDINKALELNPNMADAYKYRGAVFYIIGKYDEALADFNKANQINPSEDIPNLIALVQKEQVKQNTFDYDQCVKDCIEEYSDSVGIWVPIKDYCKEYCSIRQAQIEATGDNQ